MNAEMLSFTLGAGLLLVAILGGGFEIKEVKIPKVGWFPRVSALVLGSFFLTMGILGYDLIRGEETKTPLATSPSKDEAQLIAEAKQKTMQLLAEAALLKAKSEAEKLIADAEQEAARLKAESEAARLLADAQQKAARLNAEAELREKQRRPVEPVPRESVKGYLVVLKDSNIAQLDNLKRSDKICGTKKVVEFLRAFPPLSAYTPFTASAPAISQLMMAGVCNATFVFEREHADRLFPVRVTGMRLIPVYGK